MQGYDGVMLLAEGLKEAGSPVGSKVQQALEDLKSPVVGLIKTYDHPFSKSDHEAIKPSDAKFVRWVDGKLSYYTDSVVESLTPADMNR
jgi:branched-chain amino acid transport system substrate-binding protein